MLSVIIQEHNEGIEFVSRMLDQVSSLSDIQDKELIFVTSSSEKEFIEKYKLINRYNLDIRIFGNIHSPAKGRNVGGVNAKGDKLLFLDCHVCFDQKNVNQLLSTLRNHPDALIGPAIDPIDFPSCRSTGSNKGYGVIFKFTDPKIPFEWSWADPPKENGRDLLDKEFVASFISSCAFVMEKHVWDVFYNHGGFLGDHIGVGWEEEKCMRLWRLGYPTYVEPRAVFGHYFKGHPGHKSWDEHSAKGLYTPRITGFYVNVFNQEIYNHIDSMLKEIWREEYSKGLKYAQENYFWLRKLMEPYADRIDEKWFIKIK